MVIPAQVRIHGSAAQVVEKWVPAFAGTAEMAAQQAS